MRPLLLGLCLVVFGACAVTPTRWEKPGATEAAVKEALDDCRTQARLSPEPRVGTGATRPGASGAIDRLEERDSREAEQLRRCMREKGFRAQTR